MPEKFMLQNLPFVSIGMPVFNGAKYVRDALDSLLSQSYTRFELIISDNASIDETEEICREYALRDSRIKYVRQRENIGAANNFQFVLEHSQFGIFMWAAHDDLWRENHLADAVAILEGDVADFVFPSFEIRSINLNLKRKFDSGIFRFVELVDKRQRVLQFLSLHHNAHKCNIVYSLFRREFLIAALKKQSIENDGILGAVILEMGRGKMLRSPSFIKRYPNLWPGSLSAVHSWFYKNYSRNFEEAKSSTRAKLLALFPQYANEIGAIFSCYYPYTHNVGFQICPVPRVPCDETERCPFVSVGMPVYNGEKYIREALNALLAQTFDNFELIISDNASTDATGEICREYAASDSRIRYIRQQENIGALPNFQYVLDNACGEYFMWAACDDKWDENWVELLSCRLRNTESCAVFGRVIQIDEGSQPIDHPANNNQFQFSGGRLTRRIAFYIEFEGKGKANLFYSMFKREAITNIRLSTYRADYLVLFDLLNLLEFVSVKNVYLHKRIHESSDSTVTPKSKMQMLLDIVTLRLSWRSFCVARSYLNSLHGKEWLIIAMLIPVKLLLNHAQYIWHRLGKSLSLKTTE